jgi:predicted dehydrogenase
MKTKTRVGMIGAGQVSQMHLETYKGIQDVEVVAIANRNFAHAQEVGQKYSIQNVFSDFRELLACGDIQAVDVCLHNNLHMPVTLAALEAGKHVFCEKPIAGSYRDAEKMVQVAKAKGLILSIQLNTLFSKESRAAKALIDQGLLGQIFHARSVGFRRRGRPYVDGYGSASFVQKSIAGGGALYDMGVYHIANLLYLLGNPKIMRISGKVYQETEMDPGRKDASGFDVEELGLGFIKLEHGITLDVIEAWAVHLGQLGGSSLLGSLGGLCLDPFGFFQSTGDLNLDTTVDLEAFLQRTRDLRADAGAYESPQHHWVAVLQDRVEALPTAELTLNTMLISEGIYLSDRLGREVDAEEVVQSSQSTALTL